MKITKVHLRWHKSFNTNTQDYTDRIQNATSRPWNALFVPGDEGPYDFVEIPIEHDITTIVGANESGKSHLLDAISKVLEGSGNDDRFSANTADKQQFSVVDLCHFAAVRGRNSDVWPNIGLSFGELRPEETAVIAAFAPFQSLKEEILDTLKVGFTLIVAPQHRSDTYAYVYIGEEPVELTEEQLVEFRQHLPVVNFIKSNVPLSDEITLQALAAAYAGKDQHLYTYDQTEIKQIAEEVRALTPWSYEKMTAEQKQEFLDKVQDLGQRVGRSQIDYPSKGHLEALLFDQILGVTSETLDTLDKTPHKDRPYIEGFATTWSSLIKQELNLSQYWQQDPFFALQIDIKQGVVYFEITDKTGATYSFGERSSGLRYFLSYYIQAKALEKATDGRDVIILMDEPDSFLSTQGQRNLLAVFESLINVQSSRGKTQLIYTTHSPWLLNRNFPQRLRLVRKGDGEEGTQNLPFNSIRRYEPVRSALGVDCAQVLFLGASNLIVEGATEQFLLSELVRCYARPDNLSEFLDLNSFIMVASDGAGKIPQLVRSSRYGNEVPPGVAVLVDADKPGKDALTVLHTLDDKGHALLPPIMTTTVAQPIGEKLIFGTEEQSIQTIEDLLPAPLYRAAVQRFFDHWQNGFFVAHQKEFENFVSAPNEGKDGNVSSAKKFLSSIQGVCDKHGIAQSATEIIRETLLSSEPEKESYYLAVIELETRLKHLCLRLRECIACAEVEQRGRTGSDNITQTLRNFLKSRPNAAAVADIRQLLQQLEKETELLGVDSQKFTSTLGNARQALQPVEKSGQTIIGKDGWKSWKKFLKEVERNPLSITIPPSGSTDETEDLVADSKLTPSKPRATKPLASTPNQIA